MLILLLFATGLFSGTVDAIAGGGGLISLPVLLSIGLPPHLALGTNKMQGTIGTLVAVGRYSREKWISFETVYLGIIFSMAGAISGAVMSQVISSDSLKKVVPILLLIVFLYSLLSPKVGNHDRMPRVRESIFYFLFGLGLGFYDGFLGPGTGSFWVFSLMFFLGFNLIKATAHTKVFNLSSSFIATICFALGNNIDYRIALAMGAGQLIGGRLGAGLAIRQGARLIRPLFLFVVFTTIASLIFRRYASWSGVLQLSEQHALALKSIAVFSVVMLLGVLYLKWSRKAVELDDLIQKPNQLQR